MAPERATKSASPWVPSSSRKSRALDIRFEHSKKIYGDDTILAALRLAAQSAQPPARDINPYLHAGWRIREALPVAISIDHLMHAHAGDARLELCGKLAIARTILQAERSSSIYCDRQARQLDLGKSAATWFTGLVQVLTENCRKDDLPTRLRAVALVVFNYDRCIEHYLYHALRAYYSISPEAAAEALTHLHIFHPYGVVGSLPWRKTTQNVIEFGAEPEPAELGALSRDIRTFTEGMDQDSSDLVAIRAHVKECERLVFLGFAFHSMNLELLLPLGTSDVPQGKKVYGTALGISESDVRTIMDELVNRSGGEIDRKRIQLATSVVCTQLFHEYRRSLAFS